MRSDFGERVRELRLARGFSQETLGERAGLSFKFVGEIERGVGNPTLETIAALAQGLEVAIPDLFRQRASQSKIDTLPFPLSRAEFDTAREALDSLGDVFERLQARQPPRRRRR